MMIIFRNINSRLALPNFLASRKFASDAKSVKTEKTESGVLEYEEVAVFEKPEESVEYINRIRNKSRLAPHDLNRIHGKKPYEESVEWYHDTVRYKKRLLGRYGLKSLDVPAGIAWPTKAEVEDLKEYERVSYPNSLQENWKMIEEKKLADEEEIRYRESYIEEKLKNMTQWRADLQKKINQKEASERAAREKKEKMIEEIRRHYGVNVHPKSAKFKELLEKKEEEDRKKKKAMQKEEKAARSMLFINKQLQLAESAAKAAEMAKSDKSETPKNKKDNDKKSEKLNKD